MQIKQFSFVLRCTHFGCQIILHIFIAEFVKDFECNSVIDKNECVLIMRICKNDNASILVEGSQQLLVTTYSF